MAEVQSLHSWYLLSFRFDLFAIRNADIHVRREKSGARV